MSQIRTPDFERYSMDEPLVDARQANNVITVEWHNGVTARFHTLWLRDNDASDASIAERSRERKFSLLDIPSDIHAVSLSVSPEGGLQVHWSDGVRSLYHPGWLRAHDYSNPSVEDQEWKHTLWGRGLEQNLPLYPTDAVMVDPKVRLRFLKGLREYGVAILTDAPTEADQFERIASRVGMLRDMNWGKVFDVDSKKLDAYLSSTELPMEAHSDAPTREYMPGLQIFQCVQNTVEGGASFWVDGYHVAHILKRDHPDAFDLLTTVPWPHASRNKGNNYRTEFSLFQLDKNGQIDSIRDTPWLRAPLQVDFDQITKIYDAYRKYVEIKADRENQVERKLKPGEIAFVDNRRCLHGRREINASEGHRHFRTAYGEREELLSTIRYLERELTCAT